MSTEKVVEYVKTNKRSIIKKSLIAVGITLGIVVTAVLLKKDKDITEEYMDSVENYLDSNDKQLDEFLLLEDTESKLKYARTRLEDAQLTLDSIEN